jgi:ATP-dependent Clp protease ATP-binding subunit ClpA
MFFRRRPKIPPPRPPDLPFDEGGMDAIGGATEQARAAHASAVHAEHLLFAMLDDPAGVATRALARLGHDAGALRGRVERTATPRPWGLDAPVLPIADDLKGSIEFAMREARATGRREVGTGELLLGVLQSPQGVPRRVLGPLVPLEALRSAIATELRGGVAEDE